MYYIPPKESDFILKKNSYGFELDYFHKNKYGTCFSRSVVDEYKNESWSLKKEDYVHVTITFNHGKDKLETQEMMKHLGWRKDRNNISCPCYSSEEAINYRISERYELRNPIILHKHYSLQKDDTDRAISVSYFDKSFRTFQQAKEAVNYIIENTREFIENIGFSNIDFTSSYEKREYYDYFFGNR